MGKIVTATGEVLYLSVIVAGLVSSAWQHSLWITFWVLLLATDLTILFRKYSNITYETYNNIYEVNKPTPPIKRLKDKKAKEDIK